MRFILSASLLVVASAQSQATIQRLTTAVQACTAPLTQALQYNQQCSQQVSAISTAITGTDTTGLTVFCASPCLSVFNTGYANVGKCMQQYTLKLTADLTADGVANPALIAHSMTSPYNMMPEIFNLMCTRNERGDYCMPLFSRMSKDLAVSGTSPTIADVCNVYFNTGCCLTALDHLYSTISPTNISFIGTLTRFCPSLTNFAPPNCLMYGQSALALTVTIPLTGLNCAGYAAQSADFQRRFEAALKTDLAAEGINANYVSVKSILDANGVCTLTLVVRANDDASTKALTTAASTANTVILFEANGVLMSAPNGIATGNITMGAATVQETTIKAQTVSAFPPMVGGNSNAGSSMAQSFVAALFLWLALA